MSVSMCILETLRQPRAAKGSRSATPIQRMLRELDRVWSPDLVDAMVRVACAEALGERDVVQLRLDEIRGHERGASKRIDGVRRGARELLMVAREVCA